MSTILVIEDEPRLLDNIIDLLDIEGYTTFAAAGGQAGIQLALKHRPDLIICDVMMPDVSGYEVLDVLRERPETATVPFIFLTALADKGDLRQGMNLGADDYLTKPFDEKHLLQAVQTRLRKQATQQQEQAKALEDLRGRISQVVPHELRTPLMVLVGYTNLLKADWPALDAELIDDMLGDMVEAGQRLQRLVENYSLLNRLHMIGEDREAQKAFCGEEVAAIESVVVEVVQRHAVAAKRADDVACDVEPGTVPLYSEYMAKIVSELLDNALKFSDPGTPIQLKGRQHASHYRFTVSDQGRGMTDEQIAAMGDFTQFDREHYEQQGMGMGLSLVARLAEVHEGCLTLESKPNIGTTIRIDLPLLEKPVQHTASLLQK